MTGKQTFPLFFSVSALTNNVADSTSHIYSYRSHHYLEKASALDFKDASAPQFGQSDVAFRVLLLTKIKRDPR